MMAFARQVLAVLVAFAILAFFPLVLFVLLMLAPQAPIPSHAYLSIELREPLMEHYGPPRLGTLLHENPPCLMEITENLEKAAVDDRIQGVIFTLDGFSAGLGKIDEIRHSIREVQAAGKSVYAYASEMTDDGIYLASACDSAYLFPQGTVYFLGMGATIEHIKGTLEKLGIHEQIHRIDEYKSAAELFTSKESSPQTLDNIRWIMEDMSKAADSALAENLSIPRDSLVALRNRAIFRGEGAVSAGLVDRTMFWDELVEKLGGDDLETVTSAEYSEVSRKEVGLEGSARIAVVHAQGFVATDGDDRFEPVVGLTLGADRVVEDLETVTEDDRVRSIVLRWDTGGGATSGAERIARAVQKARQKKPVVVSIADQAASGGYMMSQHANRILCPGNGITGSIGSVTGKLNLRGLFEKLGVTVDDIALSPNAFLLSPVHDYTEAQWAAIQENHWGWYRDWISEIADLRGMTVEEVDAAARGRVWTGRQAQDLRLIDELGGFDDAVRVAKELADIDRDANVSFVHFPPKRTLLDVVLEGNYEEIAAASLQSVLRSALGAHP
jgi:protease-4